MHQSTAQSRQALLIDIEEGALLQTPPECAVSERYVDTHPFIERTRTHVIVGPDAAKVAGGSGGVDYALYEIVKAEIGMLHLKREV